MTEFPMTKEAHTVNRKIEANDIRLPANGGGIHDSSFVIRHSSFVIALLSPLLWCPVTASAANPAVEPFFKEYCIRCHNAEKHKGDFRIDTLSDKFSELLVAQEWDEVMLRINSGEMPPKDEKQPPADATGKVTDWIAARLDEGRAARMSQRTPVALYRLSREEYAHTVEDLLGVRFDIDAPGAFSEDPRWHGFDRIGSLLTLSPSHVDRYFDAAVKIIAEAFPDKEPSLSKGRIEATDARAQKWLEEHNVKGPVRSLVLPGHAAKGTIDARFPGLYRIRIHLSALPSARGRIPHLSIWDGTLKRSLFGQDVSAPEETPTTIEIETFLSAGRYGIMNQAPGFFDARALSHTTESPFTHSRERRFVHPGSYQLFEQNGASILPLLLVDQIEWEGPIIADADRKKREGLFPATEEPAVIRASLARFLDHAWRRPVSPAEIDECLALIARETAAGEKFRPAYLSALVAALTSKNFYYIHEGSPGQNRDKLNDWEFASRLSHFLWGSMPDEPLFAAARDGSLGQTDVLRAQVGRMLNDPKVSRFLDSFPRQWLQLNKVGTFPADSELYPDYDKWLEESMVLESTAYFRELFAKNLSIREFLTSDWTMLNPRLAIHYGLPPVKGDGFQRVTLPPDNHRGGLLTQASVLSLTSDGVRHRPVHRGVWVSEAIYGKTPPPPPPNVEALEPTPADSPKATIRMQLEAHATNASCASCHRKIDPLGFAFDNYDAIGRWRTHEQAATGQGENPPVNATGRLPNGSAYNGPDEFKHLLAADMDRFATAFTGQLATYALRRVMTIDDAAQIKAITQAGKKNDYKLRKMIENLVTSELFKRR